ncbi:DUF3971 domain-containing protein [Neorhizobium alkalisoli]|uniref:Uncharacterized protein DUF3971 n=1 Tax=Neorhizobium alkalisoli TaxID=528178 RepID=A0A561QH27_9HYPH|nr:DUF3971 domain-containing protein [Neorhizobium alkalisoli]TWF49665.1 uncharacterized protein DUF3971 [Neorhizobium alkalisoli]
MAEIRGERLRFSRKDIVPLHDLPSAQVEDPIIVHCPPPRRSRSRRIGKTCVLFLMLVLAAIGSAVVAIEGGIVDGALSTRAQSALNAAIGPRYVATVGSTVIRFDSGFRLAIEARDVDIIEQASGEHLSHAAALRMAVGPLALLSGRVEISNIEAQGIRLDTAQLPSGDPMPLSQVRVDAAPALLEQAFQRFDEARGLIERTGTASVKIAGIEILLPAAPGRQPLSLVINELDLARSEDGEVAVNGSVSLNGKRAVLAAGSKTVDGVTSSLSARLSGLDVATFLLQRDPDGQPREGLDSSLDLQLSAVRSRETVKPVISAVLNQSPGRFFFDGIEQTFSGANINIAYDFTKNSIEILKSEARFGPTILPLTGGVIDLSRLDANDKRPGFGLDLLVSGGTAAGATNGEQPAKFDLKGVGRYLSADRELQFDEMAVSSPLGRMAGALKIRFGDQSPEISFGAQLPQMQLTGVKQLWPFWMARKPRDWVMQNMFGGTLTNATIGVFIPAGRMKGPGQPLNLNKNELRVSFDLADGRVNLPGDVPPLRDVFGHFDLKGEAMQVDITKAGSFFPSGRSVSVDGGRFSIPNTYAKPLMAEIALKLSGSADAVTELASFQPINGLKGTDFKPADFTGNATVDVKARMGLIKDQNPPKPSWNAHVNLSDVALATPMSGRRIANVNGTLDVDPQAARLNGKGTIDDVPADIMLVQPVDSASPVKREQVIKAVLNDDQREKLVPGLSDIVQGSVGVELTKLDDARQGVSLDLTKSALSIPWIGWTKGNGVPAKAQFELTGEGEQRTELHNFQLDGDGFGAKGNVTLSGGSLSSAEFSNARLSPSDNFSVAIKRSKGIYDISIGGASADIRPIITKLRSDSNSSGDKGKSQDSGGATLRAKLDRLVGFNDENLSNVTALISLRDGSFTTADLSAVSGSGQAVVSEMSKGSTISITSGDAGAFIRFANLYNNMRGGLLNLRLKAQGSDWVGSLDIRSFSLVDDQRLQSLVSTPVGKEGESLNAAVKKNIDVSAAKFQRGFASIAYKDGALSVGNGVVRGEQIGATFQGMLRDARGNMEMTGTFMPAYGLNRLFGELPLIGNILGNGRDRGLLGITFKLEGSFDKPKLSINPLSLIAPGVFRQIFEFQ